MSALFSSSLGYALMLGGVPALSMGVSTLIGLGQEVPDNIAGALQHFAAGVLLCTVGTELLPDIADAEGWAENIAAFVGFFCGVAVLILLGMISEDEPSNDDSSARQHPNKNQTKNVKNGGTNDNAIPRGNDSPPSKFVITGRRTRQRQPLKRSRSMSQLMEQRKLQKSSSVSGSETEDTPLIPSTSQSPLTNTDDKSTNLRDSNEEARVSQFPMAFLLAVAIDSSLDGLLIGIASFAGPSAGPMMSASLSVEMGFLGLTLSTTLQGQPFWKGTLAAILGPSCLVLGAGLGGLIGGAFSQYPVAQVGLLSFGASALLFMVAEELLLDAHEDGEHVWWVDLQLYVGFFSSMIAGKFAR